MTFSRLNPLSILYRLIHLIKNYMIGAVFLFVFKAQSESTFILIFKVIFLLIVTVQILSIFINWWTFRYNISNSMVHIHEGVFVKKQRHIEIKRIQNVQQQTTFLHRIFKSTALTLETGTSKDDSSVTFPFIKTIDALIIEDQVLQSKNSKEDVEETTVDKYITLSNKTIHFTPTKKELIKAAFTSFRFLAFIPLLSSLYFGINDWINIESEAESIFNYFLTHLWLLIPISLVAIVLSIITALITTYLKYGRFEIAADEERIYIKKGVLSESSFSITKDKVQAIQFQQSILKRMFGLVEVKLVSAGGVGEEKLESNSLFPYLSVNEATQLVEKLLPKFHIPQKENRLPPKALFVRCIRPPYIWFIISLGIFIFKREWLFLSLILFIIIYIARYMDYRNTRYEVEHDFIKIRTGALTLSSFVTRRVKIQEIEVTNSMLQRKMNVASIQFSNRAKPTEISVLKDIPKEFASTFANWYKKRTREVQ